jgi:hypothetical protein
MPAPPEMPAVPAGWPVKDDGLLMAYVGPVMGVYLGALTDASWARHLVELRRAIDGRRAGVKVGVLYHLPGTNTADARRRKEAADFLESRRDQLRASTAAYALATPSSIVRGVLRAIYWLSSPPYPHAIVATPREGFAYIATKLEGVPVDRSEREWDAMLRAHLGDAAEAEIGPREGDRGPARHPGHRDEDGASGPSARPRT